ncbi:hypothetical protein [Pseudacidovorax sp. NFM-22]|uniref:hypothetical protein n=1 Tax=Pseudacidovorax sp. NFM-22 TaxID=2744469 RepID=UPI001F44B458|nr:hypothetical protein [Pseudacidovorax sp. NFM-22]
MVNITLPDGTTGAVNAATANDAENLSKLLLGSARRVGSRLFDAAVKAFIF